MANEKENFYTNEEQARLELKELIHDAMHCLTWGKPKIAIELFDKALELNPNLADCYYHRGNAYKKLNNTEAALENYKKALEIEPDDVLYIKALDNLQK